MAKRKMSPAQFLADRSVRGLGAQPLLERSPKDMERLGELFRAFVAEVRAGRRRFAYEPFHAACIDWWKECGDTYPLRSVDSTKKHLRKHYREVLDDLEVP